MNFKYLVLNLETLKVIAVKGKSKVFTSYKNAWAYAESLDFKFKIIDIK